MNHNRNFIVQLQNTLETLQASGNYRTFSQTRQQGKWVSANGKKMLNLSSNDYLGIASDEGLQKEFLETIDPATARFSASSSRLLSGNFASHEKTEQTLAEMFGSESALIFNSGYHANLGILPAISDKETVILADKFVHASLIDGIRLSAALSVRFRHNDYQQLENLIKKYSEKATRIIVVTESIFSMDGDLANLPQLIRLKKKYPNVLLYVDEAHALGTRGEKGLGYAEECGCIKEIDFLVGTFGKAAASMGAYLICKKEVREYLINSMRPLIFSTALPPIVCEWTNFVLSKIPAFSQQRQHLAFLSEQLKTAIQNIGYACPSDSNILPIIVGDSQKAVQLSTKLQTLGFYALPVRPPSVPEGTARIRISLSANIIEKELEKLTNALANHGFKQRISHETVFYP